ncbi:MAG: GntR family transcriptional regulator [Pseudomonadota bacterium]
MPKDAKSACLDDLKRRILSTDLAPGADLDEAGLASDYGLSRTPLREVLQRLAGAGFVRLEANRGAKVASMDLPTLRTFYRTAPVIYAHTAALAAEARTDDQLEDLRATQVLFRAANAAEDPRATALANHRFHEIIGEMAANPYLMASLDRLLIDHTRLSHTFYSPAAPDDAARIATAANQHDAMIAAIEDRNPAAAQDLALRHWDLSRDQIERYVRADPLPVDPQPINPKPRGDVLNAV